MLHPSLAPPLPPKVWDTLTFASNGLVFFWAGVASINYFLRCVGTPCLSSWNGPWRRMPSRSSVCVHAGSPPSHPCMHARLPADTVPWSPSPLPPCSSIDVLGAQAWSYAAIPCIYIFMMLIRTGCLALFNLTFFRWIRERERRRWLWLVWGVAWFRLHGCVLGGGGVRARCRHDLPRESSTCLPTGPCSATSNRRRPPHTSPRPPAGLTWAEVAFTGWCGLRGAISLIMAADFIAHRCAPPRLPSGCCCSLPGIEFTLAPCCTAGLCASAA